MGSNPDGLLLMSRPFFFSNIELLHGFAAPLLLLVFLTAIKQIELSETERWFEKEIETTQIKVKKIEKQKERQSKWKAERRKEIKTERKTLTENDRERKKVCKKESKKENK